MRKYSNDFLFFSGLTIFAFGMLVCMPLVAEKEEKFVTFLILAIASCMTFLGILIGYFYEKEN